VKCGNAKHLRESEITVNIYEIFAGDNSDDELLLHVDESDSELEDESGVSDARNNDARDTNRTTRL
jgi:hypothetical protein